MTPGVGVGAAAACLGAGGGLEPHALAESPTASATVARATVDVRMATRRMGDLVVSRRSGKRGRRPIGRRRRDDARTPLEELAGRIRQLATRLERIGRVLHVRLHV